MPEHRPHASLDHMSLGVNDLGRSKLFYDAAFAPLGFVPHLQIPGEVAYGPPSEHDPVEGFAFYIGFEDPAVQRRVSPSAGCHVALRAPSREAVRQFYRAALAAGGQGNGEPGLRPQYHANYYGAFVLDPDGHHIEAVHKLKITLYLEANPPAVTAARIRCHPSFPPQALMRHGHRVGGF